MSETFIILRRIERDKIKTDIGLHVKYPISLSDFNETSIFSIKFRKKYSNTKLNKKNSSVGTKLFHADGQMEGRTDRQTIRQTDG